MKKIYALFLLTLILLISLGSIPVNGQKNPEPAALTEDEKDQTSVKDEWGLLEDISYSSDEFTESVHIKVSGYSGFTAKIMDKPDRIVIDIEDVNVPSSYGTIRTSGRLVDKVRYSQFTEDVGRVVLDVKENYKYKIEETDSGITVYVYITASGVIKSRNITYHNNYDRVYFLIRNAQLTTGTKELVPLYTDSLDESGEVYTVTFPSENADIDECKLDIHDEYLRSFEIKKNDDETTSLIFTGDPKNSYLVFTRESGDTAITIAKPAAEDRKIVVIDAGHGGTAIGAAYGKLIEKELNLDIAKRMEALLKEKGVETYMIRSDDSNVDNYERAYIANMINAKLYISIHNNGTASKKTDGTMTLYCPSDIEGFNGKDLAKIIQKNMLSMLKTTDRGIRSRPDLIVLRETNMPAALAEVAFITNAADRTRLNNDAFKQKAARSLCDSVIKALELVQ